ncbi:MULTISPECIES: inner membrane-spanning protein YciB [Mameliella]|uniref:inner membrane-spanning protein YciB n=1 Tax=Mameliella TaxID=1434019 RepID=UPI000B5311F4|nr:MULTISPECIES: inner membrane-spanning protein YciB [Mameliella]MBY6120979.1 septation protein IspZ [Mameliella alba]OWV42041.1 intracellular septation protein A [Mameliella alba]OWV56746.1 intracellular septation protein A [Mameliella alba]OWV62323.1 intracellular septation protein A [Mameliella alba]
MEQRQVNPMLKTALEFGPILGFFAAYLWLKDRTFVIGGTEYEGFIVVTAGFIPVFLVCMGALWALTGHLSRMQVVTAVLIVVFGGLSVWLNDDRFFKMKPTLIYLLFGGALAIGLMRGESWLQYVMDGLVPLQREGWMILTKRVAGFFLLLAVLNEVIWRTMDTEIWVYFKTFGLTVAIFLFFMFQGGLFKQYGTQDADEE